MTAKVIRRASPTLPSSPFFGNPIDWSSARHQATTSSRSRLRPCAKAPRCPARKLERAEEVFPSEDLGRPARSLQRYSPPYHSAVPVGGHQRPRFRRTGVTEYWIGLPHQSGLMLAARITLPHFSVSSAISLPNWTGDPGNGVPPRSARRAFILGSSRAALTSLLSLSTIAAGMAFGALRPYQIPPS